MKKATTTKKMYLNLQGITMAVQTAKEFYGNRFETAILAKVFVNKNGTVIGSWE